MEQLMPITIKGAKVTSMVVQFNDKEYKVEMSVSVALIDKENRILTSISLNNNTWTAEDKRLELSVKITALCSKIRVELNDLITRHMNKYQNALPTNSSVDEEIF